MGSDSNASNGRHPPNLLSNINRKLVVPRAFTDHPKVKYAIYCIIENFGHEEQQAIGYFYYVGDASIKEIAERTKLTENRVLGAVCLYAERLEAKLNFFKKTLLYDENDVLQITDILFHDVFSET